MGINTVNNEEYLSADNISVETITVEGKMTFDTLIVGNLNTGSAGGFENAFFPQGTKALFHETAAPVGWTKVTSGADATVINEAVVEISNTADGTPLTNGGTANPYSHSHTGTHTHSTIHSHGYADTGHNHDALYGETVVDLGTGTDYIGGDGPYWTLSTTLFAANGISDYTEGAAPVTSSNGAGSNPASTDNQPINGNIKYFYVIVAEKE